MVGQIEFIQAITGFNHLFHECVVNQFSLVTVKKKYVLAHYFDVHKNSFFHLNKACYNLQAFCETCLDNCQELANYDKGIGTLRTTAVSWKNKILDGCAFLTYSDAEFVITGLIRSGYDFHGKLFSAKYQAVPKLFLDIPSPIKSSVRIDFYGFRFDKYVLLKILIQTFQQNQDLFQFVECMEIAIDDSDLLGMMPSAGGPSISIFFDRDLVQKHDDAIINLFRTCIPTVSSNYTYPYNIEFSQVIDDMVFSQGRRNYKKFLQLLSIIDEIYDRNCNYAFVK